MSHEIPFSSEEGSSNTLSSSVLQELKNMGKIDENGKLLPTLKIGNNDPLFPIVQGGMGIGISTAELAGAVARHGGIGTLSLVVIGMIPQYKPLYDQAMEEAKQANGHLTSEAKWEIFKQANLNCIQAEVRKAKALSEGKGLIFGNIMIAGKCVNEQIITACEAGIDGIAVGAGISFDLPRVVKDFSNVAIGPIISDSKWVKIFVEKWKNHGRIPDFFIFEQPGREKGGGGHLGAKTIEKLDDPQLSLSYAIPEAKKWLKDNGYDIPVIGAGGVVDHDELLSTLALGADGAQLGTRFLASEESNAHHNFKQAIVNSTDDDIITYMSSVGLPARALRQSPILHDISKTKGCLYDCLNFCAFRDNNTSYTQMCIVDELLKSTKGGSGDGLMFAGKTAARIKDILSTEKIMKGLIGGSIV